MRLVALVSVSVLLFVPQVQLRPLAQGPAASEVAAALQAKYDRIKDFSADFTQQYESGVLKRKIVERGKLQVKKPGKMRWDYTSPEEKLFVSDGQQISLYVPADKQVTISRMPKQDEATTAVLFLIGRGSLTRDFSVTFAEKAPPGTYALRLQPKIEERDYDWLEIVVDQKTLEIRSLTAGDRQGGQSTFFLSNFKENVGLADKTFAFKPPRGTDVTYTDKPSR